MSEGSEGVPVRLAVDLMLVPGHAWAANDELAAGMFRAVFVDFLRRYEDAGILLSAQVTPEGSTRRGDLLESLPKRPAGPTAGEVLEEARSGAGERLPGGRYMHLPPEEALDVPALRRAHGGEPSLRADAAAYLHDFEAAMRPFDNNGYSDPDEAAWLAPVRALASLVSCLVDLHPEEGE